MPLIHVFDLGNVLLLYDYGIFVGRIRDCCRKRVGIEETVAELYRQSGIGRGAEFEPFYQAVVRSLGLDMPLPEFRLAWGHEFMDNQASFRASVQGQNAPPGLILGEKFARDTVLVGTGVTVPLSDSTNVYADYDAGLNPDITTHTVSIGLRTRW